VLERHVDYDEDNYRQEALVEADEDVQQGLLLPDAFEHLQDILNETDSLIRNVEGVDAGDEGGGSEGDNEGRQ
jgi:hypothetical protein